MALSEWLHRISQHFIDAAYQKDLNKLVKILREAYLDEVKDLTLFTQQAERMYYPHLRERLQQIVAEEQVHIQWLREKILVLGGDLPTPSAPVKLGNSYSPAS
jgi:rubrerythrin